MNKNFRLHILQHVPFEIPAFIELWAKKHNHKISKTFLFECQKFPKLSEFDFLVVMGGPMSANDDKTIAWLSSEKKFIKEAIDSGKIVLGICLGSQLIASVLGAKVYPNKLKEIGWHKVKLSNESKNSIFLENFPKEFTVFQWHGDTFDLPKNSIKIASSKACKNQAFVFAEKVIGLQFHLESTKESIEALVKNCENELIEGKYIQSSKKILENEKKLIEINNLIELLLNNIESNVP